MAQDKCINCKSRQKQLNNSLWDRSRKRKGWGGQETETDPAQWWIYLLHDNHMHGSFCTAQHITITCIVDLRTGEKEAKITVLIFSHKFSSIWPRFKILAGSDTFATVVYNGGRTWSTFLFYVTNPCKLYIYFLQRGCFFLSIHIHRADVYLRTY